MATATKNTKLIQKFLTHMGTKAGGESHGSILLSGDPGIGKTTVVSALARLFGMEIMLIEVPHITEEHIINIPFIVFNPLTHTEKTGTTQITPDYRIVLSQSNLYSLIRKAKKVPDGAYIQNIYSAPKDVINTFEYFGGSQTKVPDVFQQARNNYDVILFLDEYFRQTSPRIRNMLRGILNNRIGMHEIPSNVYIVYASNMKDQGLEDIGQNPQFTQIKMHSPDKEEWFDWLIAKFEKDEHVKLKPAIISHFRKILKTEDLSHDDVVNEVRTSPRRWEQLLLYINASLPVKDEDEAKGLLTNVKTNFYNYISHEHSDLAKKVMNAVVKLIKVTSNLEVQASTVHESHEWRNALSHQIAIKMKLGEHRKYIPVVSGAPGIGKTSNAIVAAEDNNLRFIDIDVSELSAEDVIGLPLPGKSEDGEEMATTFSTPKLYQQILNKIKITEEHYIAKLRKDPATAEAKIKEYQNQRWKYLIFFDELNRTDDKTFNSLRRILLEKNFGPSGDKSGSLLSLPPESIIIAAINPHDINTVEFTHHFKDVLDISHATSSWKKTLDLMRNKGLSGVVKEAKDISINVISTFANKFRTKSSDIDKELQPFHLDLHTDFYFSPREYMDLFTTLAGRINPIMQEIQKTDFNAEPDKITTLEEKLRDTIFESLEDSMNFSFEKHHVEGDEFMHDLRSWVMTSDELDIGENIFYKKAKTGDLDEILEQYLEGKNLNELTKNMDLYNYMGNANIQQFVEHLSSMLYDKIKTDKAVEKYILNKDKAKKILKDGKIVNSSTKVSLLENFILSLIYTLRIHDFSNEQLYGVWKGLSKGVSSALTKVKAKGELSAEIQDKIDEAGLDLRSDIHNTIASM